MEFKLYIVKSSLIDISNISGDFQRADNSDGLGEEFSFTIAINRKDRYWPKLEIEMGDKIIFTNDGNAVFTGMIMENDRSNDRINQVKAYDYGYLMNKSQVNVQFRKISASSAIEKLCNDYSIPVGRICNIATLIDKIYSGDAVSDCFKDIISQASADTGQEYRMEVRGGLLFVEPITELVIKAVYKGARNIAPFDVTTEIADLQIKRSIADMRNSVKIISSGEQSTQIIGEAVDDESISRFGIMQHVETISGDDLSKARSQATNRLKELNKVTNEITLKLMGDDAVRSGRILEFNEEEISGRYKVINCTHTYGNNNHYMDLTLEAM